MTKTTTTISRRSNIDKSCRRHVHYYGSAKTPSMKCVARFVSFKEMRLLNTIFLSILKRINVYNDLLQKERRWRGEMGDEKNRKLTHHFVASYSLSLSLTKTSVPLWYLLFFIIIIITSIHSSYLSVFFHLLYFLLTVNKNKPDVCVYMYYTVKDECSNFFCLRFVSAVAYLPPSLNFFFILFRKSTKLDSN